jgi:TonB family protein
MVEIRSLGEKPRGSALALSVVAHCVGLLLFLILRSPATAKVAPVHFQVAQVIRLTPHVAFVPNRATKRGSGGGGSSHSQPIVTGRKVSEPKLSAGEALRQEAKQQSAAIINSLKFEMIYGFYPGHKFKLAERQSGEIPHISPDQLPPRYGQIVLIDLTIDTKGKVADARIVAGMVDPNIQQILLAAVREFKYAPATRDDVPIPSEVEVVIPVPS